MKNAKLLVGFLLFSISAKAELTASDPYVTSPRTPTHQLDIRVIRHGLKGREAFIEEQIRATETVYSQCPGLVLKINVTERIDQPSATEQENSTDFIGNKSYVSPKFLDFMKPYAGDREQSKIIDVHMHEFLNEEIRKTKQVTGAIHFGQSFNDSILNRVFLDPRTETAPSPTLSELVGETVHLAIETVALNRSGGLKYKDKWSHPRNISLMAHEIGHLLLEAYDPVKNWYGDHWCPTLNDSCPDGFLMSAGGNDDNSYTVPNKNKVLGYDALPKLDAIQCDRLLNSSFIRRL